MSNTPELPTEPINTDQMPFARLSTEQLWFIGTRAFGHYVTTLDILNRPEGYFTEDGLYHELLRDADLTYDEFSVFAPAELASSLSQTVRCAEVLATKEPELSGLTLDQAVGIVVTEAYKDCNDVLFRNGEIARLRPNPLANSDFLNLMHRLMQQQPYNYTEEMVSKHLTEMLDGVSISRQFTNFPTGSEE